MSGESVFLLCILAFVIGELFACWVLSRRTTPPHPDPLPQGGEGEKTLTDTRPMSERETAIRNHLAQVTDDDHCLAAVREILSLHLLESAALAGSINSDDTLKLRSCERMECFRLLLVELEIKHAEAKEWRREQAKGG